MVANAGRVCALGVLLLLGSARAAHAQVQEDNQVWLTAEGRADLTRSLRLSVQEELRLGTEAGFDETFTDIELGYRINKFFSVAGHYRLIFLDAETRHRVTGDLGARWRRKPIELRYRLRLQSTTREGDDALVPVRNKFTLAVAGPHDVEPFVAVEVHYLLSPVSEYRERRFYLGAEWRASDRLDVEVFYLNQRESNVQQPEANHVLGLMASWQFRSVGGGKGKGKGKDKDKDKDDADREPIEHD